MSKCTLYANAQSQCEGNKVLASSDFAKLEAEKKSLTQKIGSIHQFWTHRALWTSYTRHVANRLPTAFQLTGFQGSSPLDSSGRTTGKKTLRLPVTVQLLPRGAVPPEVFKFVAAFAAIRY